MKIKLFKRIAFLSVLLPSSIYASPVDASPEKRDAQSEIAQGAAISSPLIKLSQNLLSVVSEFLSLPDLLRLSRVNKKLHEKIGNLNAATHMTESIKDKMQAGQYHFLDSDFPKEERPFYALDYLDEEKLAAFFSTAPSCVSYVQKLSQSLPLIFFVSLLAEPSYGYDTLLEKSHLPIVTYDVSLLEKEALLSNIIRVYLRLFFEEGTLKFAKKQKAEDANNLFWILPLIKKHRIQISIMFMDVLEKAHPFMTALFDTGCVSEAYLDRHYFMQAYNLKSLKVLNFFLTQVSDFEEMIPLFNEKTPDLEYLGVHFCFYDDFDLQRFSSLQLAKLKALSFSGCASPDQMHKEVEFFCKVFPKTVRSLKWPNGQISQKDLAFFAQHFDSIHHLDITPYLDLGDCLTQWLKSFAKHQNLSSLRLHFSDVQIGRLLMTPKRNKAQKEDILFKYFEEIQLQFDYDAFKANDRRFSEAVLDMLSLMGMKADASVSEDASLKKILIVPRNNWQADIALFCFRLLKGACVPVVVQQEIFDRVKEYALTESEQRRLQLLPKERQLVQASFES